VVHQVFAEGSTVSPDSDNLSDTIPLPPVSVKSGDTSAEDFAGYQLLEEIARGGMGVVFRALQTKVNRVVALKMILSGQLASEEEVRRFRSEAEAAALLDHPNIVPVFDVGECDGRHYFSMGYIDGQSLAERLKVGPLSPTDAAALMVPISDAVACAHDNGVIHRDLKPSNVLIDSNGAPRVTDFGLARQMESASNLTATGQVMGTPSYMPPEQAAAETDRIDARSDVYSLGAILYTLVTGRPPFQAAHIVETLRQVIDEEPVEPRILNPDVDADLETICLKCLNKEPSQRYQTATELVEELKRYLDGRPILARSVTRTERLWRWCRRNQMIAALTGTAIVSLLTGTVVSVYFAILAEKRAALAETGVATALTALESAIDKIQNKLRFIPAAQEIRRELLKDAMESLQKVSGQVQMQSRVDVNSAKALVDLGLLFVELGDEEGFSSLATAEANFRSAVRIFRETVPEDETDPQMLRDKSWALCECGSFLLDQNQLNDAEGMLQEALDLRRQLLQRTPEDPMAPFRLSVSLSDWSDLLAMRRQFQPAISFLVEALELAERAASTQPDHPVLRDHVIQCMEKLGDAYHDLRDNDRALPYFEQTLQRTLAIHTKNPESADACNALSYSYERLGNHYLQTGNAAKALEMYSEMKRTVRMAIELDPRNRRLKEGLVFAHGKTGKAQHALGLRDEARASHQEAQKIRRLLGKD
jgi:serine/threonine protein kinase